MSDTERNYKSGAWGSGDLDAEALASKYGLDRSNEGRGEGHIWGRGKDGAEVYIGKSNMGLAGNKDLIKNHSKQANSAEVNHSGVPEDLSSLGDIKGAILTEFAGGSGSSDGGNDEPEEIVHSEEIRTAKERVKTYEDNILSGKTSDDIYGKSNDLADDNFLDDYQLSLNKGAAGAGTPAAAQTVSEVATDNFLESKKAAVKKEYNFKPAS